MFNELKWHSVVMCVISLIAVDDASAGWFGPNTYAECVLDEMKGRPQYMGGATKDDCRAKFCTFVPLTNEQIGENKKLYSMCIEEYDNKGWDTITFAGGRKSKDITIVNNFAKHVQYKYSWFLCH